jgi:hypothetical protein
MKTLARAGLLALLLVAVPAVSSATTWGPVEVECPICHTRNKFLGITSYGSYIYQQPSKYQYIFWPLTDSPSVYTCRKCFLSAFLFDFASLPQSKLPEIQKTLLSFKLVGPYKQYTDIPMSQRLAIAEAVYKVVVQNDEWWSRFYRVKAFHLAAEKKEAEATEARKRALEITLLQLAKPENKDRRKELLLISGSMRLFTGDEKGALKDLEDAERTKYKDQVLNAEQTKGFNDYLSGIIKEMVAAIKSGDIAKLKRA